MNQSRHVRRGLSLACIVVMIVLAVFTGRLHTAKKPIPMPPGNNAPVRLTDNTTEDDFPALARSPDGTVWLAYVAYQAGKPVIKNRVLGGAFDELIAKGNGDQIHLMRFDGKAWQLVSEVTPPGQDVSRPAVAVDGKNNVVVAWSQQVDGNWDIYQRQYTPAKQGGTWSDTVRISKSPGSDHHVAAAADARGTVWLAWQSWQKDNFDIRTAALGMDHPNNTPRIISISSANDWSPAIAADSKGGVFVAWDTYDRGNYDVLVRNVAKEAKVVSVARSARFEARPSIVFDAQDRMWIAYEDGDEQWGKDSSWPTQWLGIYKMKPAGYPGFGLYTHRQVKVRCLADGKLMQPAMDLADVGLKENKSLPRLAIDGLGGLWLLCRYRARPDGRGEAWISLAYRYDGKQWTHRTVKNSAHLMDNRPALLGVSQGILAVHSSDSRTSARKRSRSQIYSTWLNAPKAKVSLKVIPADANMPAKLAEVHPSEAEDIKRIRSFRQPVNGKNLKLFRGDFHRHTEFTAHRDGDGTLEDSWRYAIDAAALDWLGNGDHDSGYNEYMWWLIQKTTDLYHNPPHFVAVHCYERSNVYPNGHRNVIMPRRGIRPLPRGSLKGTAAKGTPDTKILYRYLKHFGGMCASHTSATGMGTDWRDNDPEVEPVVEIFQGCRQKHQSYEYRGAPKANPKPGKHDNGYVWNALAKGRRLGFQASSDHFSTHISYAIVLAEENSRAAIISSFKQRRCYGANDNIIVSVRSGNHLMGEAFTTSDMPTLDIKVQAPRPVAKISIIRNNKVIHTMKPGKRTLTHRYVDKDAGKGTSYYYVRVEQEDGSLAWASPMWITYKP